MMLYGEYAFKKGDEVPGWLAVPGSSHQMYFGADVRVKRYADRVEVRPERPMESDECMIHGEGHELPDFPLPIYLYGTTSSP